MYTKLPHNKLLIILDSLTESCFDGGESKYIAVNNYGACWAKKIKDKVICLKKQQIKGPVTYLLFNGYFTDLLPDYWCSYGV